MKRYHYSDDRRGGLKQLGDRLGIVLDDDAREQVSWDIVFGVVPKAIAEKDGFSAEDPTLAFDPRGMFDSRIPTEKFDEVAMDIVEDFVDTYEQDIDWELEEGEFKRVGIFNGIWIRDPEWFLHEYDFDVDVDSSTDVKEALNA